MRKLLVPLTFAAASLAAGSAFAATTTGMIEAINLARPSVTLEDGTVYVFQKSDATAQTLQNFKVGDQVRISWDHSGMEHDALQISPVN